MMPGRIVSFVPRAGAMRRTLGRPLDCTTRFVGAALAMRVEARPYAPLVYAMLTGAVWMAASLVGEPHWITIAIGGVMLLGLLAPVCAIDARFGIIPDGLVIALAGSGCLYVVAGAARNGPDAAGRLAGAAIAFAVAWLFRAAYRRLRGFDGLGLGDVKLFGAGALWTGLDAAPAVTLVAVTSAFATVSLLHWQGKRMVNTDSIAFGPHLALGIWLGWIAGVTGFTDRLLS